jgi:uncharacterized protein (TIGR02271 family)
MTTTPQPQVVAAFTDRGSAEQALGDLRGAGFDNDQIKCWVGASSGGFLEAVKSAFSGQEGTSSHVYDDLTGSGVPDTVAKFFQREADAGRTIVAVMAADRQQEASNILARYGGYGAGGASSGQTATDYASTASNTGQTSTTSTRETGDYAPATGTRDQDRGTEDERKLRLREEQLRAQKQPVQTGEVRLGKEVVTEEQTLNVPVNREEVYIERHPVDQPVPADTPIGDQGETYRVPVTEERVNVEKQPVVREEIGLGKRVVQENQQVTDTVRREEARLDRSGDVNVQGENGVDNTSTSYNQ